MLGHSLQAGACLGSRPPSLLLLSSPAWLPPACPWPPHSVPPVGQSALLLSRSCCDAWQWGAVVTSQALALVCLEHCDALAKTFNHSHPSWQLEAFPWRLQRGPWGRCSFRAQHVSACRKQEALSVVASLLNREAEVCQGLSGLLLGCGPSLRTWPFMLATEEVLAP